MLTSHHSSHHSSLPLTHPHPPTTAMNLIWNRLPTTFISSKPAYTFIYLLNKTLKQVTSCFIYCSSLVFYNKILISHLILCLFFYILLCKFLHVGHTLNCCPILGYGPSPTFALYTVSVNNLILTALKTHGLLMNARFSQFLLSGIYKPVYLSST